MKTIEGYDVKIFTDRIDENALEQIKELLSIDVFSEKKIRVMPDVHAGAGCVIGFTGDLGDKVIPNIVGVDIGCGMRVLNLGKLSGISAVATPTEPDAQNSFGINTMETQGTAVASHGDSAATHDNSATLQSGGIDFHAFHEHIRGNVPSGMIVREERFGFKPLVGAEMDIYREAKQLVAQLYCYRDIKDSGRINKAIGSLGGGNHFIELDKDDEGNVYLVIHTGSRNLGKQVADIYQAKAVKHLTEGADEFEESIKRTIEEYKAAGRRSELQGVIKNMRKNMEQRLPAVKNELCYVEGETREQYLHDMRLCQRWAVLNRKLISLLLLKFFPGVEVKEEFESVHNYISDANIIRKGAISAGAGERCIIPLNMRDGSLICTGKGNPDWNCSAPHGAGRVLSRSQAYAKITMEEFENSMQGIYSESVNEFTRDESPMVYKPADEIIANIGDTVTIDTIIRPIFNFKASK